MESVLRGTATAADLLVCASIANLACLRAVSVTWKQRIEGFLRFHLECFVLAREIDSAGFDSQDDADERGRRHMVNLIDFVAERCRSLRIIQLHFWMPASLLHKLQHTMSRALILDFYVEKGVWLQSDLFSQWVAADWCSLQSLSMSFKTEDVPSGLENWMDAITEHLRDLRHLKVEFDFEQYFIGNDYKRLQLLGARFLGRILQFSFLESLGFVGFLPDMAAAELSYHAHLKFLSFGAPFWKLGEGISESVEACLRRLLPHLSHLDYLKVSNLALSADTVHAILENAENIGVLSIDTGNIGALPNVLVLSVHLQSLPM